MADIFKIINADTDSISICYEDERYVSPEERAALHVEINKLFPPLIKFADDGYGANVVIFKAKNYCFRTEDDKIKTKGSSLKSSKIEPAIRKYQERCLRALLKFTDEKVPDIYLEECRKLATLETIEDWSSRKALSEKTFNSSRKNERSLREAVAGSGAVIGDRVQVYFDVNNNLKLVESYDPAAPDHNLPRLLKKLFTSSKLFDTVLPDFGSRTNYGLSTKAKVYNDMVRAKVLPVKEKKPSVKNSLQELVQLLTMQELICKDAYGAEQVQIALETAVELLKPKEKKPRKKKDTPISEALEHELAENINDEIF